MAKVTTFYMNDSVKICQKGSKIVYCNEFSLMFQQGSISNLDLSDTSIMHLNWGVSLVEQLQENLPEQGHNTRDYKEDYGNGRAKWMVVFP